MRRTTSLTALLLGATLLAPTGHAIAAVETCRGEVATIVGVGDTVEGTEGRDVIVTGSAMDILAGAGDDVICVTGAGARGNLVDVDAGPGNDLVDSTAMARNFYLTAILGDGSDIFIGGAESEFVVAGAAPGPYTEAPGEAERDVIDTGGGGDGVISGGPGLVNDDEVRTGGGDDNVTWSGTMGPQGVLDAGEEHDTLLPLASGETFGIDLAAQTLTRNGVLAASFSSFEVLSVRPQPDLGSLEILGSSGDDVVEVRSPATVRASLGGGVDSLDLTGTKAGSSVDLGAGEDLLSARSWDGSVDLDLTKGTLVMDGSPAASLAGVENALVIAEKLTLVGDARANHLNAVGCRVTVNGRGGKDQISHSNYDFDADLGYDCSSARVTLRGGSGNDRIDGGKRADRIYGGAGNDRITTGPAAEGVNKAWGGAGNDRLKGGSANDVLKGGGGRDKLIGEKGRDKLIGGTGRDKATGGPGRDRCSAEIKKTCER